MNIDCFQSTFYNGRLVGLCEENKFQRTRKSQTNDKYIFGSISPSLIKTVSGTLKANSLLFSKITQCIFVYIFLHKFFEKNVLTMTSVDTKIYAIQWSRPHKTQRELSILRKSAEEEIYKPSFRNLRKIQKMFIFVERKAFRFLKISWNIFS